MPFKERQITNQALLDAHHRNACVHVKSDALIYDAISLAQDERFFEWAMNSHQAHCHPALMQLCHFWNEFSVDYPTAIVPVIHLLSIDTKYDDLYMNFDLPIQITDAEMQQGIHDSSVIFGERYLVTFIEEATWLNSSEPMTFSYYGVSGQCLFDMVLPKESPLCLLDSDYAPLAEYILKGLHQFPRRFPDHWRELRKAHEEDDDDSFI